MSCCCFSVLLILFFCHHKLAKNAKNVFLCTLNLVFKWLACKLAEFNEEQLLNNKVHWCLFWYWMVAYSDCGEWILKRQRLVESWVCLRKKLCQGTLTKSFCTATVSEIFWVRWKCQSSSEIGTMFVSCRGPGLPNRATGKNFFFSFIHWEIFGFVTFVVK